MTILDQFGQPVDIKTLNRPDTRVAAAAEIRDRWSTYPSNGLTPSKLAQILRAADNGDMLSQAELFEEMEEKDAHLFSQFQTRKLAVQGLAWDINPGDESAKAREIVKACEDFLGGLTDFDDNILDMLDALAKGYSVLELLWDVSEGQAMITGMDWIHPKKITFFETLIPRVLTEAEPVNGEDLRPFKFVYHRYKARSGHDTRAGIMRVCAWMYLFKNYNIKDWVGFAEVFGKPLRLGKYDSGASKEDKDALSLAVRMLGSDAAGIISKATEIEFVEARVSGSLDIFQSLAAFCDAQVSKAVLGQTLTSGTSETGGGAYALGNVHNEVRGDLTRADAKALGRTVSLQVLRPFVGFNFGWDAPMPVAAPIYEAPDDMEAVGKVYQVVSEMIDISQEHVSERFKIPMLKEGETPLKPKPTTHGVLAPATGNRRQSALKHVLKHTATGKFTPEQQAIEDLIDGELPRAAGDRDQITADVVAAAEQAESYEEMQALLAEMLRSRTEGGPLAEKIAEALLAANMWGRYAGR